MLFNRKLQLKITIYLVLFLTFIFPLEIISPGNYPLCKIIFMVVISVMYFADCVMYRSISKFQLMFTIIVIAQTFAVKDLGVLGLLCIPYLERIMDKKEAKEFLEKTNFIYLCILLTIFYSIYFAFIGENDRGGLVFTGIGEINQSGLSIFCLGCILKNRNKILSKIVFLLGILTISRSYILALILLVVFSINYKHIKCLRKLKEKIVKYFSYNRILWLSNFILVAMGIIFCSFYKKGMITTYVANEGFSRFFNLMDYSNFFRFEAIYVLISILINNPKFILFGMSDLEYTRYANIICTRMKLPFRNTPPHNLFFSHLKLYGCVTVFETMYISRIIKEVVNEKNLGIVLAAFFYSIILGAGLYSYWLYLTVFAMVCNE